MPGANVGDATAIAGLAPHRIVALGIAQTPEGRQLVYRYTRNREPMFYDDL